MNTSVESMIRETIEMLFEERTTDSFTLNPIFQALIDLSERFDISPTEIMEMIMETAERKKFETGIVAWQFMSLLRYLRKGPWKAQSDPNSSSWL